MGQVTMRTSSKPRWRAASARFRASPECPQMTGSARTTITRRRSVFTSAPRSAPQRGGRGVGADGRGSDGGPPVAGLRAEPNVQAPAAVELRARQPGAIESLAVEVHGLYVLNRAVRRRLDEP